jgi:Ca2+-binding RTX toxin-like protein
MHEFLINTFTHADQLGARLTTLNDGGWVAVWQSYDQDGSYEGLYGQRYDAHGNPVAAEFQVNTYTDNTQASPAISALADGGWVVSWHSYNQEWHDSAYSQYQKLEGIYAQRYDANGARVASEFRVNNVVDWDQADPAVTALPDGGWLLLWHSQLQDGREGYDVYGQRYDAAGGEVGGEFLVNSYLPASQSNPSVSTLADGGWIVVWQSASSVPEASQDGDRAGVYAQRYDVGGNPLGAEFQVNTYTALEQYNPQVAALPDGGWLILWQSSSQDGDQLSGIYSRRFDASGNRVGAEVRVNTFTRYSQQYARIAVLGDGGWLVTWESEYQDGSYQGVYAQRFDASGAKMGTEVQITSDAFASQRFPDVTALQNGGWLISWSEGDGSGYGVYGRRYDVNGNPIAPGQIVGSHRADRLLGAEGDDFMRGLRGNDTLIGNAGADTLNGGAGADIMKGGSGADLYYVDNAADRVVEINNDPEGVAGFRLGAVDIGTTIDRVLASVSHVLGAYVEKLTLTGHKSINGTGNGGNNTLIGNANNNQLLGKAGNDTLVGNSGNDLLRGGAGADRVNGNAGADTLDGGLGADSLTGGAGNDTYIVDNGNDRVVEYRGKGTDTVKAAMTYRLPTHVERLVLNGSRAINGNGNNGSNRLTGNGAANRLIGNDGNDTLVGNAGADVLNGGNGRDVLNGNAGNDLLIGATGLDRLNGGTGADRFRILNATSGLDTIGDFKRAQGDRLQLVSRNFRNLAKGTLNAGRFVANATGLAQDGNDYFVFNTRNKTLYFDRDADGTQAPVAIAKIGNGVNLRNTDITLV